METDPRERLTACPPWVVAAAGDGVRGASRARWGFRHETWIVERDDGSRFVLQQRVDGSDPRSAAAVRLRALAREAGLPTPEPVRVRIGTPTPDDASIVVALPFVEGTIGAELLSTGDGAAACGACCGEVAARLATIDTAALGSLRRTWASGALLRRASAAWLAALGGTVSAAQVAALEASIDRAAAMVDGAPARLAHGDLAPVNVLIRDGRIAAVLDLDRIGIAHPAYDAAWFSWVVTYHHPDVADSACAAFATAAGTPAGPETSWLWPVLLLERLAEAVDGVERARWATRLTEALAGG